MYVVCVSVCDATWIICKYILMCCAPGVISSALHKQKRIQNTRGNLEPLNTIRSRSYQTIHLCVYLRVFDSVVLSLSLSPNTIYSHHKSDFMRHTSFCSISDNNHNNENRFSAVRSRRSHSSSPITTTTTTKVTAPHYTLTMVFLQMCEWRNATQSHLYLYILRTYVYRT